MGPIAPTLALLGGTALVATLAYALTNGYLASQVSAIGSIAWGQVLLVDVYVGFALIAGWMGWREAHRPLAATGWIIALLVIGNLVACAYVLRTWWRHRHDAHAFWLGPSRSRRLSEETVP